MPRKRMIHPDFFSDEKVLKLSIQARFLLIGTWTEADDAGRLQWSAKQLAARIFPSDDAITAKVVAERMKELEQSGIVKVYESEGISYAYHPNFPRYQAIKRPTPSKIPPPPGSPMSLFDSTVLSTVPSTVLSTVPSTPHEKRTRREAGLSGDDEEVFFSRTPSGIESKAPYSWGSPIDQAAWDILDTAWIVITERTKVVIAKTRWRRINKRYAVELAQSGATPDDVASRLCIAYDDPDRSRYYRGIIMLDRLVEHWAKLEPRIRTEEAPAVAGGPKKWTLEEARNLP